MHCLVVHNANGCVYTYVEAVGDLVLLLASGDRFTFTDTPIRNSRSAKNRENISMTTDSTSSTLKMTERAAVTLK